MNSTRKLKFRVWDDFKKEFCKNFWMDGIDLANENLSQSMGHSYGKNWKYIIQQFTGLKDKSGRDIYEGDILKGQEYVYSPTSNSPTGIKDMFMVCEYDLTRARFLLQNIPLHTGYGGWDFHNGMENRVEIVGNIFETPELIKA